ncbi:MAG: NfeD family protein [Symbiobacteriia bacterium]
MFPWRSERGVAHVGALLFLGLLLAGLLIGIGAWFGRSLQGQVSTWLPVVLMVIGFLFLVVEAGIPGFGIFGFTGILLLAAGIMTIGANVQDAVRALGLALVLGPLLGGLIGWQAYRRGYWRSLSLGTKLTTETGYVAMPDLAHLVGKRGRAASLLRPAGAAEIDGQRIDVVTEGGFIPAGARVVVLRVEGRRVVVEGLPEQVE